eukprot:124138-Pelagomonas_calceolata.AAC.3
MQALAHRSSTVSASARVQGSRRIAAVPVCACRPQHQQRSVATRAAASDPAAFDFSEFAEDLDVNVSAGVAAPLATENGKSWTGWQQLEEEQLLYSTSSKW